MSMRQIFEIPGYKEILDNLDSLWKRAVLRTTSKGPSQSFTNTRNTTDGYSAARILPSAKAFGKAVTKRKQAKLWGRYVPCDGITNASSTSIDTGIKAQGNMELLVRVKAITGSFYILQARSTGTATIYGISGSQNGQTINFFSVNSGITRTDGHVYTIKATYVSGTVTLYVKDETTGQEDTKTGTVTDYTFPSPSTIKLFGDASKVDSGVTVYRAYVKINGEMAWNMYPCVDVVDSNKVIAYDDVTHTASEKLSGSFTGGSLIQPISYIHNPRVQTSVKPNQDTKVKMRFKASAITTSLALIGARNSSSGSERNGFIIWQNVGSKMRFDYQSGSVTASNDYTANAWNTVEKDGTHNYINEVAQNNNASATFQCDYGLAIGTNNTGGTTGSGCEADIAEIYIDNVLYMPVGVGTSVYYLDTVVWTLLSGTGTAGADIPYTEFCPDILETNVGDALYGQWGKNLFDSTPYKTGYYIDANGQEQPGTPADEYIIRQAIVQPSTTYTVSFVGVDSNYTQRFHAYDKNGNWISQITYLLPSAGDVTRATFTAPSNCKYVRQGGRTQLDYQLEEGSTATPHEPYHFGLHPSGEQKVFMGEQGVVADLSTLSWSYSATLGCGKTFYATLSAKNLNGQVICFCDGYTGITANSAYGAQMNTDKVCWIEDGRSIRFHDDIYNGDTTAFKASLSGKVLFYLRPEDASFIPPQSRTIMTFLPSANSFVDAQKASNNVECDWKFLVFDGTEGWSHNTFAADWTLFTLSVTSTLANNTTVQTHGTGNAVYANPDGLNIMTGSEDRLFLSVKSSLFGIESSMTGSEKVAKIKAYLAAEYAKGTPVIVCYPLATPEVTTLSLTPFELNTDATRTLISQGADGQSLPVQAQYLGI